MAKIIILGAGKVGTTMAIDLAGDRDIELTLADRDGAGLSRAESRVKKITGRNIAPRQVDLSQRDAFDALIRGADVVIGALSSVLGFRALQWAIEARRPYCDISFMAEDALAHDDLAKKHQTTAIVDCGVAPGLSNLLAGQAVAELDPCDSIAIYVGGIPRERHWPYEYKAAFAPHDVIEEYVRPARLVERGDVVAKVALSEVELIDFDNERFPGVGTLEAFNTDGLRSLATTLSVPDMKEKTMRYPGHADLMRLFRETGLFRTDPIDLRGMKVRPLDLTSALLFPMWEYREGERDLTVMRVVADGSRRGTRVRIIWELFDEADHVTGGSSMSRTTGFPATIMARMLARREISRVGVLPPERLAPIAGFTDRMLAELARKGVAVHRREVVVKA